MPLRSTTYHGVSKTIYPFYYRLHVKLTQGFWFSGNHS